MKKRNSKKNKISVEQLIEDDAYALQKSKGNGILRRQIWCDNEGNVTRYSLAYINHRLFSGDNGRVVGYDNAHGFHHKHYMGKVESIHFNSFTEIEECFQRDFEVLHEQAKKR